MEVRGKVYTYRTGVKWTERFTKIWIIWPTELHRVNRRFRFSTDSQA